MSNIPDLLEQFTWAINEGGPAAGGRQEVYEFLSNVGRSFLTRPATGAAPKPPTGPYPPDLLPLIQQLAWNAAESAFGNSEAAYFLQTVTWYLTGTGPKPNTPPYLKPTFAPLPTALQSVPIPDPADIFQIAYWLINEGVSGNKKARAFIEAIGWYLGRLQPITVAGSMKYPYPNKS
jgi:hypothetical protein